MTLNLTDLMAKAAVHQDSTLSVRSGLSAQTIKTFPEVVADVRALQICLHEVGVVRGDVVGLQAAGTYECMIWDLALIDMGVVPHMLPEDWPVAEVQKVAEKYGFAFFVSEQAGTLVLPRSQVPGFLSGYVSISPSAQRCDDPDLLTRVYSSGTTGVFKGLLISRKGVEALASEFVESFSISDRDRYLFFLPLSHFQQRLALYMCLYSGVSVMLTPYTHVFHDIPRFRPTFLIGPPIFYETALATLMSRGAEGERAKGLNAGFGGNLRFMITGMAPIRRNVLEAYQRHGVNLLEAYGITEVGLVTWNVPEDNRIGTVGKPLTNHRIVLAADSEILVQARQPLSKGYFESDPDESQKTFLDNGAIATGDIGEFAGAHLVLKGRKKDIIVTSGGAKFHPAELEERILRCESVKQAVVISDDQRGDVVAVISVDDPHDEKVIAMTNQAVEDINTSVPTYKRIARSVLTRTRFTLDNGMLTRNLKPNRVAIARHFSTQEPYSAADSSAARKK